MGHVTQQAFNVTQPNKQGLSDGKRGLADFLRLRGRDYFKKRRQGDFYLIKPTQCFLIMLVMKWTRPCERANRRG